jgi:hypothetical protein
MLFEAYSQAVLCIKGSYRKAARVSVSKIEQLRA